MIYNINIWNSVNSDITPLGFICVTYVVKWCNKKLEQRAGLDGTLLPSSIYQRKLLYKRIWES